MNTGEQATKYDEKQMLDDLADKFGLAIVLADEYSPALNGSNNNSMCATLYDSEKFAPECEKFCGKAFEWATAAGEIFDYKCYAGLNCSAVPLRKREKQIVAIVGRAFTKADDYRNAASRAVEGDWQEFPANDFFENVLLNGSETNLKKLARKVQQATEDRGQSAEDNRQPFENEIAAESPEVVEAAKNSKLETQNSKLPDWRSIFASLRDLSYRQACFLILQFVADRHAIENVAWLERKDNRLEAIFAKGKLKDRDIQFGIAADDARLLEAARGEIPLKLRERQADAPAETPQTMRLFPIAVGEEIQSALVVSDEIGAQEKQIARFCRGLASDLEILRLRDQLARRGLLEKAVSQFNESLKNIDSEDFWTQVTHISAALLKSERSSLLVFDEKSDAFTVKAATGIKSDFIKKEKNLGERVSRNVLTEGTAVVVENVNRIGLRAAPEDWLYKSASFISYPITIGTRKIGVLNLTDRADGDVYSQPDLEILNAIMPQLAVLIDRAALKNRAGEFEQLSVTDALTGLLNRRYLEERLTEEIKRSNRHGFPMSFMMIDVDEFKSYNDEFGHTEGDKALQIVGICLKETLRGADVAARYGGEEFSILLPQTASEEAATIAERLRERIEREIFPNRQVTVSLGVASCSLSLNSARDLISAADQALYEAKRKGRNNVRIYEKLK